MDLRPHFFFAIKLPDEIKAVLKQHLEKLQKCFPFKSWVHYEDLHITLVFLGAAPLEKLQIAEIYAAQRIRDSKPFKLKIHQLGIFGKQDCPRIFYADIEENHELQLIQKEISSACVSAGFQLEPRPFRPHITIGRKWAGEKYFQSELLFAWHEIQPKPLEFEAVELALYQTHLHKTPKYEAIKLFSLDGNKQ